MTFENEPVFFIIKTMICVFGTVLMMFSCTTVNSSLKKMILIAVIYSVWIAASTYIIITMFGIVVFIRLIVIIISIPAMIALYFISEYSPWQAVFNYAAQLSLVLVVVMTQTLLSFSMVSDIIIRITSFAVIVTLERVFLRAKTKKLNYLADKEWRNLSVVPIAFVVLIIFLGSYPGHYLESKERILYIYAVTAVMLLVYIVLFYSLAKQYALQMAEYSNSILKQQTEALERHIDTISETDEQLRAYRHDMRFYLHSVSELIKNGETDEALNMIGGVDKKLENVYFRKFCDNKTVNAVISYYVQLAEEKKIKTDIDFMIPDGLHIDIIDFTAMIANALDNAVNACMAVEDEECRCIRLRVSMDTQYIVEISNSYGNVIDFDENGLPVSDLKDHGIGLRSISALADRNGMVIGCSVDCDWFKLWIAV